MASAQGKRCGDESRGYVATSGRGWPSASLTYAGHYRCVVSQEILASRPGAIDPVSGNLGDVLSCLKRATQGLPFVAAGMFPSRQGSTAFVADHISLSIIMCMLGFDDQALPDILDRYYVSCGERNPWELNQSALQPFATHVLWRNITPVRAVKLYSSTSIFDSVTLPMLTSMRS